MDYEVKTVIGSAVNFKPRNRGLAHPRPSPIVYGPDDAPSNEQALRFVLLASLMSGAGMTGSEIKAGLTKYVRSLSKTSREMLTKHFPGINDLASEEIDDSEPIIPWLSKLGPDGNIPADQVSAALGRARARLVQRPKWFYGENGWFLWTAANLCCKRVYTTSKAGKRVTRSSQFVHTFWLGEFENAMWLAIMARLHTLSPQQGWVSQGTLEKYRGAWYTMFCMDQEDSDNPDEAGPPILDHATPDDKEAVAKLETAITAVTSKFVDQELDSEAPIRPPEIYFDVADAKPVSEAAFTSRWMDPDFLALVAKMSEMAKSKKKPKPAHAPANRPVEAPVPVKKPEEKFKFISPGGKITFPQVRRPAPRQK
ncbi:hypothetical protein B0T22DRAFT_480962 [Podospora appendiculata]|uniref:Uncharacterized protein n=1 Tax=Podospora appendiculata TaxID=314037 RepID=A0AAE0XBU9_9PEZI|nr:hypothetical protein B0T22DRAFT_480962 [Podospora appendiculata]